MENSRTSEGVAGEGRLGSALGVDEDMVSNVAVGPGSIRYNPQSPVEGEGSNHGTSDGRQRSSFDLTPADENVDTNNSAYDSPATPVRPAPGSGTPGTVDGSRDVTADGAVSPKEQGPSATSSAASLRPVSGVKSSASADTPVPNGGATLTAPVSVSTGREPRSPYRLALSKQNLATFEDSVQRGVVPLRTDVITDSTYADPATGSKVAGASDGLERGGAARGAMNDCSVSAVTAHSPHSIRDVASPRDGSDSATQRKDEDRSVRSSVVVPNPLLDREVAVHSERAADQYSLFSGDSTTGSAAGRPADPLSEANLLLHLRELTSGQPVPLNSENIATSLSLAAARNAAMTNARVAGRGLGSPNRPDGPLAGGDSAGDRSASATAAPSQSVLVEPSETAASEVASTMDASVVRATLLAAANGDGHVEELWSTASNQDTEALSTITGSAWQGSDVLQSLSKENLRQLRRQLESGETPLRPELLEGLSNAVRAMNVRSETSPSMVVEVPTDELEGNRVRRGPRANDSVSTNDLLRVAREAEEAASTHATTSMDGKASSPSPLYRAGPIGTVAGDQAGMSFHSTLVEVPAQSDRGSIVADAESPRDAVRRAAQAHGVTRNAATASACDRTDYGDAATEDAGNDVDGEGHASCGNDDGDLGDLDRGGEEEEDGVDKSTTAVSPDDDAHNDGSVFLTDDGIEPHDDIAYLKRSLSEVMQVLRATRSDQLQLSRQIQAVQSEMNPGQASYSGGGGGGAVDRSEAFSDRSADLSVTGNQTPMFIQHQQTDLQHRVVSLRADLDEMRLYMREMQKSQLRLLARLEQLQGPGATENMGSQSPTRGRALDQGSMATSNGKQTLRLVMVMDPSTLGGSSSVGTAPVSFLMPMPPDATVLACKLEFIRRLVEQQIPQASTLSQRNTVLELNGSTLFDSLTLAEDLHLDASTGNDPRLVLKKAPGISELM